MTQELLINIHTEREFVGCRFRRGRRLAVASNVAVSLVYTIMREREPLAALRDAVRAAAASRDASAELLAVNSPVCALLYHGVMDPRCSRRQSEKLEWAREQLDWAREQICRPPSNEVDRRQTTGAKEFKILPLTASNVTPMYKTVHKAGSLALESKLTVRGKRFPTHSKDLTPGCGIPFKHQHARRYLWFTIVRDPVARFVSACTRSTPPLVVH